MTRCCDFTIGENDPGSDLHSGTGPIGFDSYDTARRSQKQANIEARFGPRVRRCKYTWQYCDHPDDKHPHPGLLCLGRRSIQEHRPLSPAVRQSREESA